MNTEPFLWDFLVISRNGALTFTIYCILKGACRNRSLKELEFFVGHEEYKLLTF